MMLKFIIVDMIGIIVKLLGAINLTHAIHFFPGTNGSSESTEEVTQTRDGATENGYGDLSCRPQGLADDIYYDQDLKSSNWGTKD